MTKRKWFRWWFGLWTSLVFTLAGCRFTGVSDGLDRVDTALVLTDAALRIEKQIQDWPDLTDEQRLAVLRDIVAALRQAAAELEK